jgi:hypothetical protein
MREHTGMIRTVQKWSLVVFSIFLCIGSACSEPFFNQSWNRDFHIRVLENGETLSVSALFSKDKLVYLYDQAAGNLTLLSDKGVLLGKTTLESIGRDTYFGDDFVVRDTTAIFVNSVDKRLEYFDIKTGKHLYAVAIPPEIQIGRAHV